MPTYASQKTPDADRLITLFKYINQEDTLLQPLPLMILQIVESYGT